LSALDATAQSERKLKPANMRVSSWRSLMTVLDALSAQAVSGRLNAEGVPTRVRSDSSLLGAARRCDILVPVELLGRAESLLASWQFSDEELTRLATDECDGKPRDEG
jgi:hypothetical protein